MDVIPYLQSPSAFIIAFLVEYTQSNFFITIWASFVLMPLLDCFLPVDNKNVSKEAMRKFEKDPRFFIPVYMVIISDFILYFYLLFGISTGRLGSTPTQFVLYVLGGAIFGSTNTTAGHELFHKRPLVHKICGIMPWFKMLSGHLYMYHL